MGTNAIIASHLGKRFAGRRGHGHALHESLERSFRAPLSLAKPRTNPGEPAWALRNVSFQITPGECVGLIGHNGAGKSVLLRILARVTSPTQGEAELRGRVAAVLDVGTGFKRELTGRENIFFQGAILGMRQREITKKFDAIVAFSGLEEFIDMPIKGYSNGMQVRLAFAVAAHLEPEILLLDEVLAVADAEFHRACVDRLSALAREGRTILLIAHDLEMIRELCPRALWLEHGRVASDGAAAAVIAQYQAHVAEPRSKEKT
jgi:ABC-type polysaccharide/polyol phosphate transport system ATPase subunit